MICFKIELVLQKDHSYGYISKGTITYLDLFCLLRFLQIANNMNTQQRIRNIIAKRTAEIIPIFCVKETGGGIINFSTWSLIVSVLVYKIVLPSRSTWVAMHLQKDEFLHCYLVEKTNEYLIPLTCIKFDTKNNDMLL